VAYFLSEEIFAQYGTPREIVLDGGSQFTSHMIGKMMQKYGVKHRVTPPYHPHANGQVESTNKVLENILTKIVASHRWD
jgi:transposase InsO family protein